MSVKQGLVSLPQYYSDGQDSSNTSCSTSQRKSAGLYSVTTISPLHSRQSSTSTSNPSSSKVISCDSYLPILAKVRLRQLTLCSISWFVPDVDPTIYSFRGCNGGVPPKFPGMRVLHPSPPTKLQPSMKRVVGPTPAVSPIRCQRRSVNPYLGG